MTACLPVNIGKRMKWGQDEMFVGRELVYLHCVRDEYNIRFRNFPVYGAIVREGRISFLRTEGRYAAMIILDNDKEWSGDEAAHFQVTRLVVVEESCYTEMITLLFTP